MTGDAGQTITDRSRKCADERPRCQSETGWEQAGRQGKADGGDRQGRTGAEPALDKQDSGAAVEPPDGNGLRDDGQGIPPKGGVPLNQLALVDEVAEGYPSGQSVHVGITPSLLSRTLLPAAESMDAVFRTSQVTITTELFERRTPMALELARCQTRNANVRSGRAA